MKHTCGLPSDTTILFKLSPKMFKSIETIEMYELITGNPPPKEVIDKMAREVLELD